jgi:hypothetical protein
MMIKKIILLALVAFISSCSTPSSSESPALDSQPKYEAWNKTNWLMSEQEVKESFPGRIVSPEQTCPYGRSEDKCTSLTMNNFEISDKNYNVFFYFTNNQLSRVELVCDASGNIDFWNKRGCYNDISHLLTQKHGEPIESEKEEIPINKYLKLETETKKWEIGHNNIFIYFSNCTACKLKKGDSEMNVSYFPDKQKVPIKSNFYEKDKDNI